MTTTSHVQWRSSRTSRSGGSRRRRLSASLKVRSRIERSRPGACGCGAASPTRKRAIPSSTGKHEAHEAQRRVSSCWMREPLHEGHRLEARMRRVCAGGHGRSYSRTTRLLLALRPWSAPTGKPPRASEDRGHAVGLRIGRHYRNHRAGGPPAQQWPLGPGMVPGGARARAIVVAGTMAVLGATTRETRSPLPALGASLVTGLIAWGVAGPNPSLEMEFGLDRFLLLPQQAVLLAGPARVGAEPAGASHRSCSGPGGRRRGLGPA